MLSAAVVGVGTPPDERGPRSFGQGYSHARGYRRATGADLVACADRDGDHAGRFAGRFGLGPDRVFADHTAMLRAVEPDVVSVCTPTGSHPAVVRDCVAAGVDAVHCEKPLAETWVGCRAVADACARAGVTLTVNHQRRLARPVRLAKALLDDGRIGGLERVSFRARNLFDTGIHLFDLANHMADGAAVERVVADLEYDDENRWYGVHTENRAGAHWRYETGVRGDAVTGDRTAMDARMRLVGTDGRVEIEPDGGPVLRVGRPGDWERVATGGETFHGIDPASPRGIARRIARLLPGDRWRRYAPAGYTERGVLDLVDAFRTGRDPRLAAEHSLAATELAFACYESVRRGGPVEPPVEITDHPLAAMVDAGRFDPDPASPAADGGRAAR